MCERDGTADEDTEQIELFVITAYPNTRMPAIILPTLGMAGGKWDSLCFVILLDFFPLILPPAFFDGFRIIFLCAFMEVKEVREKTGKKVAEGKVEEGEGVRLADMLTVRDKHFSAVVILGEAVTSLAC